MPGLFSAAFVPFVRAPPLRSDHLPKAWASRTIALGIRRSTCGFGGRHEHGASAGDFCLSELLRENSLEEREAGPGRFRRHEMPRVPH